MNLSAVLAAPLSKDRLDCPFCHRPDAAGYRRPFLGLGTGRVTCSGCGAAGPGVAPRGPGAREAATAAWFAAAPRTVRDPDTGRFRRIEPAQALANAARDMAAWAGFGARASEGVTPTGEAESDATGANKP